MKCPKGLSGAGAIMWNFETEPDGRAVLKARLAIGLVQGIVLFLLYLAEDRKLWTDAYTFLPVAFISLFLPLVAIVGLGNVRLQRFPWVSRVSYLIKE